MDDKYIYEKRKKYDIMSCKREYMRNPEEWYCSLKKLNKRMDYYIENNELNVIIRYSKYKHLNFYLTKNYEVYNVEYSINLLDNNVTLYTVEDIGDYQDFIFTTDYYEDGDTLEFNKNLVFMAPLATGGSPGPTPTTTPHIISRELPEGHGEDAGYLSIVMRGDTTETYYAYFNISNTQWVIIPSSYVEDLDLTNYIYDLSQQQQDWFSVILTTQDDLTTTADLDYTQLYKMWTPDETSEGGISEITSSTLSVNTYPSSQQVDIEFKEQETSSNITTTDGQLNVKTLPYGGIISDNNGRLSVDAATTPSETNKIATMDDIADIETGIHFVIAAKYGSLWTAVPPDPTPEDIAEHAKLFRFDIDGSGVLYMINEDSPTADWIIDPFWSHTWEVGDYVLITDKVYDGEEGNHGCNAYVIDDGEDTAWVWQYNFGTTDVDNITIQVNDQNQLTAITQTPATTTNKIATIADISGDGGVDIVEAAIPSKNQDSYINIVTRGDTRTLAYAYTHIGNNYTPIPSQYISQTGFTLYSAAAPTADNWAEVIFTSQSDLTSQSNIDYSAVIQTWVPGQAIPQPDNVTMQKLNDTYSVITQSPATSTNKIATMMDINTGGGGPLIIQYDDSSSSTISLVLRGNTVDEYYFYVRYGYGQYIQAESSYVESYDVTYYTVQKPSDGWVRTILTRQSDLLTNPIDYTLLTNMWDGASRFLTGITSHSVNISDYSSPVSENVLAVNINDYNIYNGLPAGFFSVFNHQWLGRAKVDISPGNWSPDQIELLGNNTILSDTLDVEPDLSTGEIRVEYNPEAAIQHIEANEFVDGLEDGSITNGIYSINDIVGLKPIYLKDDLIQVYKSCTYYNPPTINGKVYLLNNLNGYPSAVPFTVYILDAATGELLEKVESDTNAPAVGIVSLKQFHHYIDTINNRIIYLYHGARVVVFNYIEKTFEEINTSVATSYHSLIARVDRPDSQITNEDLLPTSQYCIGVPVLNVNSHIGGYYTTCLQIATIGGYDTTQFVTLSYPWDTNLVNVSRLQQSVVYPSFSSSSTTSTSQIRYGSLKPSNPLYFENNASLINLPGTIEKMNNRWNKTVSCDFSPDNVVVESFNFYILNMGTYGYSTLTCVYMTSAGDGSGLTATVNSSNITNGPPYDSSTAGGDFALVKSRYKLGNYDKFVITAMRHPTEDYAIKIDVWDIEEARNDGFEPHGTYGVGIGTNFDDNLTNNRVYIFPEEEKGEGESRIFYVVTVCITPSESNAPYSWVSVSKIDVFNGIQWSENTQINLNLSPYTGNEIYTSARVNDTYIVFPAQNAIIAINKTNGEVFTYYHVPSIASSYYFLNKVKDTIQLEFWAVTSPVPLAVIISFGNSGGILLEQNGLSNDYTSYKGYIPTAGLTYSQAGTSYSYGVHTSKATSTIINVTESNPDKHIQY